MISLKEIRSRAVAFSKEFSEETDEKGEASSFWNGFFEVFGVSRKRYVTFEHRVKKIDGAQGFIDVFWPGVLLAEHKSRGRDLEQAYQQALTYLDGLADGELPQYIIVSDFERMCVYDIDANDRFEFPLQELSKHIERFGFISGYEVAKYEEEEQASIKAAELMAEFHNAIADTGYKGHSLEVFLTRVLFCLFSEDTGIFDRKQFQNYVEQRTNEDGSDLGIKILELFYVLNTPEENRQNNIDEQLAAFPYINGQIFAERLDPISLDRKARETLLKCCAFDWSQISAVIFGSLFQGVMDPDERRQLGVHYTSELNIMKVIQPLFLDELYTEFDTAKRSKQRLETFHQKLATLKFLDPACGCGNFLVTTYRELRKLEIEVLKKKRKRDTTTLTAFGAEDLSKIHVNQFYGIEIEEFPSLVARTAMYLADHQMNQELSKEFGVAYARIPLEEPATVINDNALTIDWCEVIKPEELNYILGNPPFLGKQMQTKEQKELLKNAFQGLRNASDLDFVTAWYAKALNVMKQNKHIETSFVSTNSITQGEQVSILWSYLLNEGVVINFAHRTFQWTNEARGNAAVHCVIIGFSLFERENKYLYDYTKINGEPYELAVSIINPYLAEAPNVVVQKRQNPICDVPVMRYGNKPSDGGHLILIEEEKDELIATEPSAEKFIKEYVGSKEFINNEKRYCLWLKDCDPSELRAMPKVLERVSKVKSFRLQSTAEPTREAARYPQLFFYSSQPDSDYILIPETSSSNRAYIPFGFVSKDVISSNATYHVPVDDLYIFGVLLSKMHMSWIRYVGGRLKNDYRYTGSLVYNNFPWPGCAEKTGVSKELKVMIETAAQAVLSARSEFPNSSLADLYDVDAMPFSLVKAHEQLDNRVDKAYGYKETGNEADRIAFLFSLYQKIVEK